MGIAHDHNKYDKLKVLNTQVHHSHSIHLRHIVTYAGKCPYHYSREAPNDKNKILFQLIYLFSTI